jgi:hypothetical protein
LVLEVVLAGAGALLCEVAFLAAGVFVAVTVLRVVGLAALAGLEAPFLDAAGVAGLPEDVLTTGLEEDFLTGAVFTRLGLAAGFLAAGFLAKGFLATTFLAAGFLATGFLAAGFLATTFFTAGFLAAGFLATGFLATKREGDRVTALATGLAFFLAAAFISLSH